MRRRIVPLTILFLLVSVSAYITFRLVRMTRRSPTPVGWTADVTPTGGKGSPAVREANQPTQAAFSDPFGVAVGEDGTIYISDAGESNRIRRIGPDGTMSTLAGSVEGFSDGAGMQASFNTPSGIALDSKGNIYVADTSNNRIRSITPQGLVSTVAGDGTAGYVDGPAAQARFNGPIGVAVDSHGRIFVADTYNDRIRMITPEGLVSTIAGAGGPGYADGDAAVALFDTPCGVVVKSDGSLIVADTGNYRLRSIGPEGYVSTLPVTVPSIAAGSTLPKPLGLALTNDGFLYVTALDQSRVIQIAPDGAARIIAGGGPGFADGTETSRFNQPAGIAIDPRADRTTKLYVADAGNYLVRKL